MSEETKVIALWAIGAFVGSIIYGEIKEAVQVRRARKRAMSAEAARRDADSSERRDDRTAQQYDFPAKGGGR